jgi:hypothetical protein
MPGVRAGNSTYLGFSTGLGWIGLNPAVDGCWVEVDVAVDVFGVLVDALVVLAVVLAVLVVDVFGVLVDALVVVADVLAVLVVVVVVLARLRMETRGSVSLLDQSTRTRQEWGRERTYLGGYKNSKHTGRGWTKVRQKLCG